MQASLMVCKKWGGMSIYIPMRRVNKVIKRNKQIRLEFDGNNHQDLCVKSI